MRMAYIVYGRIGAHQLYQTIVCRQGFVGKIVKMCFAFALGFGFYVSSQQKQQPLSLSTEDTSFALGVDSASPGYTDSESIVYHIPFSEPRETHRTRVLWSRAPRSSAASSPIWNLCPGFRSSCSFRRSFPAEFLIDF